MDKMKDWEDALERQRGKLHWVANVDKDDESTRMKGHLVGPPRAADQYSAEELEEMGIVGIYVGSAKPREVVHRA